jgi:hypothetical protein
MATSRPGVNPFNLDRIRHSVGSLLRQVMDLARGFQALMVAEEALA